MRIRDTWDDECEFTTHERDFGPALRIENLQEKVVEFDREGVQALRDLLDYWLKTQELPSP